MWDISLNRRIIFGNGKVNEIAGILKSLPCRKVFTVVYNRRADTVEKILQSLSDKNIGYIIYDKVQTEPDLRVIDEGTKILKEEGCDCVLGIGGGSVLDASKAIAMLAANEGTIEEYQIGGKQIEHAALPFIAVPTTSGTGSEATRVSVVYNNNNGLKKSVYHPAMIAQIVVLDPETTVLLPGKLTASTGMDALSHAIESFVSRNANVFTEMYSLKAMELISRSFVEAVRHGDNTEARGDMMAASYFAGCALNAGVGLAHIVAQPLGAMYKIPHGDACSIFLPVSMELNMEYCVKKYRMVAEALGVDTDGFDDESAAKAGIGKVKELRSRVGAPYSLQEFTGSSHPDTGEILENIKSSTGHITCNPRPVDVNLVLRAVENAFGPEIWQYNMEGVKEV